MHIHGYVWLGKKPAFDRDSDRRPENFGFTYSEFRRCKRLTGS